MQIAITINGAERVVTIEPDELPLGFFADVEEAQETGKFRPLMGAYGLMIGFTTAEMRQLTVRQFREISQAIAQAGQQATALPNESAPA